MIVSFQHRFIFVAIPKTATHALREALRPHLGARDWEQCCLYEQKRFPVPALAELEHGHITCQEVRPYLLPEVWERSFRFCFVRNPYDRFVSYCHFVHRHTDRMQRDPLGTMKQAIESPESLQRVVFRPQHEFVVDEEGALLVHYVGRVETLEQHFSAIGQMVGLPPTPLQHVNASGSAVSRGCFDLELTEMVRARYARDFALFEYPLSENAP